ncbi:MAG: hypothetical protein QOF66_6389 [Mycobacterium sp.]|jgi:hypothetical protein|nr:hypothetical protein [Mycobacterium sp.]MDT5058023.1 hypothetical protein [Mycobacterium sp.]
MIHRSSVPRNRPNPAVEPGQGRAVGTRSGAISVPPTRSRSYSGRAIDEPLKGRPRCVERFHGLVRPFAPKHQQILAFQDQPTTSNGGGLGDRPAPRPQPCSVMRAIRCCHSSIPRPGRRAGRQRRGRTRVLSISEAGALSDSLGPIRDGTASAHRQGLTADQAYRTISYDGLATLISIQLCGGRAGLGPATNGFTNRRIGQCRTMLNDVARQVNC